MKTSFTKVGIVLHPGKELNGGVLEHLHWLAERSALVLEERFRGKPNLPEYVTFGEPRAFANEVDLLLAFGGDGTLIAAARLVTDAEVLVLGINYGGMGFITEATLAEAGEVLDDLYAGWFWVDSRIRLTGAVSRGREEVFRAEAINDVVIKQGHMNRPLLVDTFIDGTRIVRFKADGVIVSSPTGSTAYGYSAGGPILHPELECLAVTPICPHTVTSRSIVVPSSGTIRMSVASEVHEALVSFDGQEGTGLRSGDTVEVSVSDVRTSFARVRKDAYFRILGEKLYLYQ